MRANAHYHSHSSRSLSLFVLCYLSLTEFILDHEYAGDVASLGIDYRSADNDYEIIVTVNNDDPNYDKIAAIAC